MTHYEDLTPYTYTAREDGVGALLNVGWLEPGHRYETGPVDEQLVAALHVLLADRRHHAHQMRGIHECNLCPYEPDDEIRYYPVASGLALVGSYEFHVTGLDGTGYAAPSLVLHYVVVHGYRPPGAFRAAVMAAVLPEDAPRSARVSVGLEEPDTRRRGDERGDRVVSAYFWGETPDTDLAKEVTLRFGDHDDQDRPGVLVNQTGCYWTGSGFPVTAVVGGDRDEPLSVRGARFTAWQGDLLVGHGRVRRGADERPERLGTYRELHGDDPSLPSLHDHLGAYDDATRRRLAFYLLLAMPTGEAVMGTDADVVDGEPIALTSSARTDGDWYWRGDLAHYVLKHGLALPPEFEEHVRLQGGLAPLVDEADALALVRLFQ